jgi:TetR/AcrR family transcriptional repressor of mexCD-oprJ operon
MTDAPSPRHHRTSAAILEAAAHLLAHDRDAALDDVAAAAGVGRATLYRHFANRELLIGALHEAAVDDIGRRLADASLERLGVEDAVARIVRATLFVGDRYAVLTRERRDKVADARVEKLIRRPMRGVFERGLAAGTIRRDVPLDALIELFGGALAAGIRLVSEQGRPLEDAADSVIAFVLGGILGPSTPRA